MAPGDHLALGRGSPAGAECSKLQVAEADGNRTHQRQGLPLNGFEDRAAHQDRYASDVRLATRTRHNDGMLWRKFLRIWKQRRRQRRRRY